MFYNLFSLKTRRDLNAIKKLLVEINAEINSVESSIPTLPDNIVVGTVTDNASAANVGTLRYRVAGTDAIVEMVMQTGADTYAWTEIKKTSWGG